MMTIPTKNEFLELIESRNGKEARELVDRIFSHMSKDLQYYYIIGVTDAHRKRDTPE